MNIYSGSKDWKERILSNFASTPFTIEINGQKYECASVEGFWQGLKCKGVRRLYVFNYVQWRQKRLALVKHLKNLK